MLKSWTFILPIKLWIRLYKSHFNLCCEIQTRSRVCYGERITNNFVLVEYPITQKTDWWAYFVPMFVRLALFHFSLPGLIEIMHPYSNYSRGVFGYIMLDENHIAVLLPLPDESGRVDEGLGIYLE